MLKSKPSCIPTSRPRGAKAAGLRYQRAFGKALGASALDGPWFEFQDNGGRGFCQPDFVLEFDRLAVILECKYSWTLEAYVQIEALYKPVVTQALGKPAFGLQVCKRLQGRAGELTKIVSSLGNGLILANQGQRVTLHWLENTPVMLRPSSEQISAIQARSQEFEQERRI